MLLCSICTSALMPAKIAGTVADAFDQVDVTDLEEALEDAGLDIDVQEAFDAIRDYTETELSKPVSTMKRLISATYSNALSILFTVALWIVYGVAKDTKSVCCGTAGLKILRVLRTIGLVLGIILMVLALLGMLFGIFMFAREEMEELKVVMIVMTAVCAVIFVLVLLFLCGVVSTLKKLISVSENSVSRGKVSGYVGFWLYVGGVFAALGALGMIAAVFAFGAESLTAFCSCGASAVFSFALARFLFRCKKELKAA
jgi:hypothetical protein